MLTARTKTIERTGTGRQFPPSLASLSATKFSLQIYMELTEQPSFHLFKGHPQGFSVTAASLQISLDFRARFSNVLSVFVDTLKRTDKSVKEFYLKLETVSVSNKTNFIYTG